MMKKPVWLFASLLTILLTACSQDTDFEGRFVGPQGNMSYLFQPDGNLQIQQGEAITTAQYDYDSSKQLITLSIDTDMADNTFSVNADGDLEAGDFTLTRGVDYAMLADNTWIGHQGQYTFSLTFTATDEWMETVSELVTYYDEHKLYLSQTDDSITRLIGNKLYLDSTKYTVLNVSSERFTLSIADNSMVFDKHPKGTEINYREGFQQQVTE